MHISIVYQIDEASHVFELAFSDLDSISKLYRHLWIISDSLHKSVVVKQVPLVLVIILDVVEVRLCIWINLEYLNFLETWANVLSEELGSFELLVKESIPEHHLPPDVKVLSKRFVILSLDFIFDP